MNPLIEAHELAALGPVVIFDCSFDLTQPAKAEQDFLDAHIPGAVKVDLNRDLTDMQIPGRGRHPLPSREDARQRLENLGADEQRLVVVYDRQAGMFAARAWWMLRWLGHAQVRLLNGGLPSWQAAGLPVASGASPKPAVGNLGARPALTSMVSSQDLLDNLELGQRLVLDARSPDRYRGENETLDPVGGHIPGAVNRFFRDNLQADGRFKPAAPLRAEFAGLLEHHGAADASAIVNQCGSGVTACHNVLALEIAGLTGSALYPGSWSEWVSEAGRPVATGAAAGAAK